MHVNRCLSDLTDQTNRCLPDTINSLHRCQVQVKAGTEKPVRSNRPSRKLNQTGSSLRFTFKQEKQRPGVAERASPTPRQARYSVTGSNEYMKVKHCHLSCADSLPPPNCTNGPLSACVPYEPHKVTHARLYATACSHFNLCVVGCGPS